MQFYLLDGAGAFIFIFPVLGIVAMFVISLIEAFIMMSGFKLYSKFKKAFVHSLLVNLVSLVAGFGLVALLDKYDLDYEYLISWAILYVATVIAEGLLLSLMNKQAAANRIWMAALVMNALTYVILFFLVAGFIR